MVVNLSVSLIGRAAPQKYFLFLSLMSKSQSLLGKEGLGNRIQFSYSIGSRTRDFRLLALVPQPLRECELI
jgi:hypothetical protein